MALSYDLKAMWRGSGRARRRAIDLRPIEPPQALASDLYGVGYAKTVATLSGAVSGLVAAYSETGPRDAALVLDAASDMRSTLDALTDTLHQIFEASIPGISTWADRVAAWHRDRWKANVLSGTGVDLSTTLLASGRPQAIGDALAWNVDLIRDVSDEAKGRMSSAIFAAYQQRQTARDLASDLRDIVDMSRRRALGIASDQLTKLSGALDRERATQAGLSSYTWRHSAKRHPRPEHVARDRKVFRYDDPPADGPPGSLPFCGCRAQARIDLD